MSRQRPIRSASTLSDEANLDRDRLERVRALREKCARAAALYAYRIERARGSARIDAVPRWMADYRRSAAKCRLLGEIIRGEREAA